MNGPIVLWVDEQPPQAGELEILSGAGMCVLTSTAPIESLDSLEHRPPDVVVVARSESEPAFVARLKEIALHAPAAWIIALVSSTDEVACALASGAHDVLMRGYSEAELRLRAVVGARGAVRARFVEQQLDAFGAQVAALQRQTTELGRENEQLHKLANHDELTGLANQRRFREQVGYTLEYARRYGGALSMLMADIDGMKLLNDTFGHAAGDAALKQIGAVFAEALRCTDLAARLGGDEFAVILPATDSNRAALVAERIRTGVERLQLPQGAHLSISVGVATLSPVRGTAVAPDDLLARADAALYTAKRRGKNRVELDVDAQAA